MAQIIQLLPEHVANQIAAGEVIQRPASAVKELLENAVDAGASSIQLIVRDGGRGLIQVIDNGSGMHELDARLAFARHATSKIKHADDLWAIHTMGFRGEAMASIAAVAQVELKTRLHNDELGTYIEIEGSELKRQEPCACPEGTSIAIKNLFFNVPARRNFLKSNPVETKHIFDEFQRVAMAFPGIAFSLINNGQEVYRLPGGTFKQRIVNLFGSGLNEKLISVNEETSVIKISGFVGKPEAARKTRGEQFFFINNRYIKNSYLNHAVQLAFQDLIGSDTYPVYFIRFEADPKSIDINIHPTKTEVKFEDERSVYAILRSAVRKSIGAFSLSPTFDFELEQAFDIPLPGKREIKAPEIMVNPDYNPFSNPRPTPQPKSDALRQFSQARWEELAGPSSEQLAKPLESLPQPERSSPWLLHGKYLCCQIRSGMMVIDRQKALERITYEKLLPSEGQTRKLASQQLLFPVQMEFNASDYELILALEQELKHLGFDFENFGKRSIAIQGVPSVIQELEVHVVIEELLEQFKQTEQQLRLSKAEAIARSVARQAAQSAPAPQSTEQMISLIDRLFACENPNYSPNGSPVITVISMDELSQRLEG